MKKILSMIVALTLALESAPFIPITEAQASPQRIDKRYQEASDWFSAQDAGRRGGGAQDHMDDQNNLWALMDSQIAKEAPDDSDASEPDQEITDNSRTDETIKERGGCHTPFTISVSTTTSGNKDLTVSVDKNGKATVTWGGIVYEGWFDFDTKQIFIDVPTYNTWIEKDYNRNRGPIKSERWTLQLEKQGVAYFIKSLVQRIDYLSGDKRVSTYYFGNNGLLKTQSLRQKYGNKESFEREFYTYIWINGDHLVRSIVSKTDYKSYPTDMDKLPAKIDYFSSSTSKTFYDYDANGRRIAGVYVNDSNNATTYSASYWRLEGNKRISAAAYNLKINFLKRVRSAKDYRVIDQFALVRDEDYYSDPGRGIDFKFRIEYAKNSTGVFVARYVIKNDQKNHYIVRGKPDVLSGESDDILFHTQKLNGYWVSYGEDYPNKSYGLVFSTWRQTANGSFEQVTIVVDYPKDTVVELDGKKYDIHIDKQGNMSLSERLECLPIVYRTENNLGLSQGLQIQPLSPNTEGKLS